MTLNMILNLSDTWCSGHILSVSYIYLESFLMFSEIWLREKACFLRAG